MSENGKVGEKVEKMLMKRFLTSELRRSLEGVTADCGFTLDDIVRSGMENPDSAIGLYAGDEDCYKKFAALFDKIIEAYHRYRPNGIHKRNWSVADLPDMSHLSKWEGRILSTRIRVGRNIKGFDFPPAISAENRIMLEKDVEKILTGLKGGLVGNYYPLSGMRENMREKLTRDHFLFKDDDPFLKSAGGCRDRPSGRGIYHSFDKRFLVWVNEEDTLRIISMQRGGDIKEVFERLAWAINTIEEKITFSFNDHLGYLSSCPTNLGTAMRASMHIKLGNICHRDDFVEICDGMQLSVRGLHGEHTAFAGGVYDISNKQRLGVTEIDCVKILCKGVNDLLAMDIEESPDCRN